MIGFVVLGYAIYWAKRGQGGPAVSNKAFVPMEEISPSLFSGFLSDFAAGQLPLLRAKIEVTSLANLSRWAFLLTFAGVGLRTNFRDMIKTGTEALYRWSSRGSADRGADAWPRSRGTPGLGIVGTWGTFTPTEEKSKALPTQCPMPSRTLRQRRHF
jgi:hypothetical protein